MKPYIVRFFKNFARKILKRKQQGAALIITLMVMLVVVLISLSLIIQSNTEHLISINEQDSFKALSDAEGVVEWANREVRTYVLAFRPVDLDTILDGALNPSGADYYVGFKPFMDTGLGKAGLTDANEETTSTQDTYQSTQWEVFRLGVDEDGDGNYDGNVRTIVYAKLFDNYEPDPPDKNDNDQRMRLEVRTLYPVYIDLDNNGAEVSTLATRGTSERHLVARFGPTGAKAIRTDGSIEFHGSLDVCGECGSSHANGTLTWGSDPSNTLEICGEATGTEGFVYNSGTIVGDKGLSGEIYIPVINPYDEIYVPDHTIFDHSLNTTVPTWLRCNGPSATDPGNSKYFAIVKMTGRTQIYKAYRNYGDTPSNTKWAWRLIGDSSLANIDTIRLDDCGRVLACPFIPGCDTYPDQCFNTTTSTWGSCTGSAQVVPQNNTFYGMNPDNNFSTGTCSTAQGETIPNAQYTDANGVEDSNNWNRNDFWQVPAGNTQSVSTGGSNAHSNFCFSNAGACGTAVPLPGVDDPETTGNLDTRGDFDTSYYISNGDIADGNKVFSPLYNAVIWIHGNFNISGNISKLAYSGGEINLDNDASIDLNQTWRVTFIVFGQIDAGGNVRFAPAAPDASTYRFSLIAGRDINLHGSTNNLDCSETDCDGTPTGAAALASYGGAIAMHEQIRTPGGIGVNGYIVAEDRASCDDTNTLDANQIFGSLDIHYDCSNPTDYWNTSSVKMTEWEEAQRVIQ
ncbi:hypothetical protein L0156_18740 [bacterium]|nr:hypothetical protein [bacterium]